MKAGGVRFGLKLRTRDLGELIDLALFAEESGLLQTLWVGDESPLGEVAPGAPRSVPRTEESIVRLAAIAPQVRRLRLGVGCMASFSTRNPLFLAAQWASLDMIAGPGRLILAACQGQQRPDGVWRMEESAFAIPWQQRVHRMVENIEAIRSLWTHQHASYHGTYVDFADVVSAPRPVTKPCPPIWIAANPNAARPSVTDRQALIRRVTRRIARHADGWMTTRLTPQQFAEEWEAILAERKAQGKEIADFDNTLFFNVNINEDLRAAHADAERFLGTTSSEEYERQVQGRMVAFGGPKEIAAKIRPYVNAGAREVTILFISSDQRGQLNRLMNEVIPAFQ